MAFFSRKSDQIETEVDFARLPGHIAIIMD